MCRGFYDEYGRLAIFAWVLFPAHLKHIKNGEEGPPFLKFNIDTGADNTIVSPFEVIKLGIRYQEDPDGTWIPFFGGRPLDEGGGALGIGGNIRTFKVNNVTIAFPSLVENYPDRIEMHIESLDEIMIMEGSPVGLPNLLGRDIIDRFDLACCSSTPQVNLVRNGKCLGSYQVRTVTIPASGSSLLG